MADEPIDVRIAADECARDIGRAAVEAPAEFWQQLHPHQALALLRTAPRVAGPWYHSLFGPRRDAETDSLRSVAWLHEVRGGVHWHAHDAGEDPDEYGHGRCATIEEAKAAADAALRAAGWLLVDEVGS